MHSFHVLYLSASVETMSVSSVFRAFERCQCFDTEVRYLAGFLQRCSEVFGKLSV